MARDNFNKPVIAMLALRVDNTCSNPECRKITQAPSTKAQGTTKIGEAAHICAASRGGARYSAEMTPGERSAYDNGIWLCSICATLVDREPEQYSVELLKRWKEKAEANAKNLLGQRRVGKDDVSNQVKSMLFGVPASKSISTITNAHTAVAQSLEALDPRFSVFTSRTERGVHVELRPLENISFKLVVDSAMLPNWASQLQALSEHGEGFKTPSRHIRFEGSALLEHIRQDTASAGGHLEFGPVGKEVRLQWVLMDPRTETQIALQDLTGSVVVGTKSGVMNFMGYEGLLKVSIKTSLEAGVLVPAFSVTLDTKSWVNCDLRILPHLQSLSQLFCNLRRGWSIAIAIVRDGAHLEIGKIKLTDKDFDVLNMAHFLEYMAAAKRLSSILNVSIKFPQDGAISGAESDALERALDWLDRAAASNDIRSEHGNISFRIVVDDPEAMVKTLESEQPQEFLYRGSLPPLTVFGCEIEIPPIECVVRNVISRNLLDVRSIKRGDTLDLIYELTEKSTISVSLLS